jgi:hypothetical protein
MLRFPHRVPIAILTLSHRVQVTQSLPKPAEQPTLPELPKS